MIFPQNFEQKIGFDEIRKQLCGRCLSTLGTEWVMREVKFLTQGSEVRLRLQRADEFRRLLNEDVDETLTLDMADLREAILRLRPERTFLEENDLFLLGRSLATVAAALRTFRRTSDPEDAESAPLYPALFDLCAEISTFPEITERIDRTLNKYGKVKDTASGDLLSIRHQLEVTARGISHSLRNIISDAQNEGLLERDVTPTLRDGRLVIPAPAALKRKIRGIVHDESATGKTVFIEPSAIVDANNRIRELRAQERREVIRILTEISNLIRPHIPALMNTQRFLAHIDYLRALAVWSEATDCCVPEVSDAPLIDWHDAVHPLLAQSLKRKGCEVVPLTVRMRDGQRILLISGPNAGGKSVCLKTIGLLQYMLQCGVPVPADASSRCGIFSDIFLDIGDEQSIENSLSTYSSHLLAMKQMMRHASECSLLLIDEFGGGTEPQIGAALAQAMLEHFVEQRAVGIITTHFNRLKQYAETESAVVSGAMLYDRAKMAPLYVLQVGHAGSSFAVEIARSIGVPESVISRASDLVGEEYVQSDKYLQDIVRDKMYWEKKRAAVHAREKQLDSQLSDVDTQLSHIEHERRDILRRAREEAKELIEQTNATIENTIRSIKEAQAEKEQTREARRQLADFKEQMKEKISPDEERIRRKMEAIQRRQEKRRNQRNQKGDPNAPSAAPTGTNAREAAPASPCVPQATNIKPGDYVSLEGQTAIGTVQSIKGENARVLFGMLYTSVPLNRLQIAEKPAQKENIQVAATFVSRETRDAMREKKLNFRAELDLRGQRADEALLSVSLFIDDAILCEASRVRILHGTGTGALRELVRRYLATVPNVRNFRDEHVQFGGAGITVVELQ